MADSPQRSEPPASPREEMDPDPDADSDYDDNDVDMPPQPAPQVERRCWLCKNNKLPEARTFHTFMIERAHCVSDLDMAQGLYDVLQADPDPETPSVDEILTHMHKHVLHPTVQIAHILRGHIELHAALAEVVMTRDEDGSPLIDIRTATAYTKVASDILQIYRMRDSGRMMFADTSV